MRRRSLVVVATLVNALACGGDAGTPSVTTPIQTQPVTVTVDSTPLRSLASAQGRYIGGVTGNSFTLSTSTGPMLRTTLAREFSMVWSGNYLKFSWLRPTATTFDFFWADSMVAFALKNNMVVRGHTLVWHDQLSTWLTSGTWTSAQADSIMVSHITTVMTRYKGKIGIWDVVNEAMGDDATIRTSSYWYQKLGPGYIERAFRLANSVDPTAKLFYNDYSIEDINPKSDAVYAMIKHQL